MENRRVTIVVCIAAVLGIGSMPTVGWAQDEEDLDTSALEGLVPEDGGDKDEVDAALEDISGESEPAGDAEEAEADGGGEDDGEAKDGKGGKSLKLAEGQWLEYPSTMGYSGLVHTMAAGSGSPMSWSVGFNVSFMVKKGFLYTHDVKDNHKRIQGAAHFRFTPIKYLELWVAIDSYANSTNLPIQKPQLFQTLGDMTIGVKGLYPITDFYTIALAIAPRFLNKVGAVGFDWAATSVQLVLANSFDLKPATNFPLRIHLNLGWDFDNSSELVKKREKSMTEAAGFPQYIMRFERFALDVNRNDYFKVALGFDFTTPWVNPFLEWTLDIPVNRQGFNCLQQGYTAFPDDDSCLDIEGFAAFPMDLTIGFRFQPPPVPGLSFLVAADIGLVGVKTHVRELPANTPYDIYLGASYAFAQKKEIIEIEKETVKEVVKEVPPPPPPHILGRVVDADSGEGIADAEITFFDEAGAPIADLNRIVSRQDGTYTSWPLWAGTFAVGVKANWYFEPIDCTIALEATGDKELECKLRPMPKLSTLKGKVVNAENGEPLADVTVLADGPDAKTATTDSMGLFEVELEAGDYTVKAEMEGWFTKQAPVSAPAGDEASVDISMSKKPKKDLVVIKKDQIIIKKTIQFEFDSDVIKPVSYVVVDAVAQLLMEHPELTLVEIQGHTDDKGDDNYNLDLSQRRADAVRDYLIACGIEADRLISKGYGETEPIAPNVTSKGRAKNRRVEFHILSGAAE